MEWYLQSLSTKMAAQILHTKADVERYLGGHVMRSSVVQGIFSGSWVLLGGGNICYISAIELICIGVIEMFLQLLCLCCLLSLIALQFLT